MRHVIRVGFVLVAVQFAPGFAQDTPTGDTGKLVGTAHDRSRTFPEQNCRVTLPKGAEWSNNHPQELIAAYKIGQTASVAVVAVRMQIVFPLDDFVSKFQEGLLTQTGCERVASAKTTFKGLDAYDLQMYDPKTGHGGKVRLIITADCMYQIQVAGTPEMVAASSTLDACMASFDFLKPPEPASMPRFDYTAFAKNVLQLTFACVLSVLLLKPFFRRKQDALSP